MFVVVSGTQAVFLHLVRHLSGVRDEVQTQLLLAIERRGAHRARVPLLVQTAHTLVVNSPHTHLSIARRHAAPSLFLLT